MPKKVDYEKVRELYEKGWIDAEIAEYFGVDPSLISRWRAKQGLKRNRIKKICISCGTEFETHTRRALRCKECKKAEISMFFTIKNIRAGIWELLRINPQAAHRIVNDMLREEGELFVREVLGEELLNRIFEENYLAIAYHP